MNYEKLLEGKRVFVTTGSQGIGKAIAILFAKQGATVCVGGIDQERLGESIQEIQGIQPKSKSYYCDLGSPVETEGVCDEIIKDFGGIDILVNTVGVNQRMVAHEVDMDVLEKLMETNYKSGIRCMKKFIPGMLERGYGNIVNISSIHSRMTMPGNLMYAGTKGAVNASARAMALDYADKGIRVNTICPGVILSDFVKNEIFSYPEGKERNDFIHLLEMMQPMKPGTSEDVANAALYLASEMSSYVTGQIIMVDGGASIKAH